jgi:CheY-like chemotaxis protein
MELEAPKNPELKLIWVGAVAPADAWRTFQRPISWPEVVNAMDQLFAPADPLDFDLDYDSGAADTRPPDLPPVKRALIASASREIRLYLRARLSLADLTQADEAETGAQALELTRSHAYAVALVDLALPDVDGWAFVKELGEARPGIPHLILTKPRASFAEQVRAWLGGAKGLFGTPPDPGKLQALLERV